MEEEVIQILDFLERMGTIEEAFGETCLWKETDIRWLHPLWELGPLLGGPPMKMKSVSFEAHRGMQRLIMEMLLIETSTVLEKLEIVTGMRTISEKGISFAKWTISGSMTTS